MVRRCRRRRADDVEDGLYDIVAAAATARALPQAGPRLSLFADRDDSELVRARWQRRPRCCASTACSGSATPHSTGRPRTSRTSRRWSTERERIVEERDAQLVAVNAARESFERALAAAHVARGSLEQEIADARAAMQASTQRAGRIGQDRSHGRERELAQVRGAVLALQTECKSLEAALAAQERIIAYQQSLRWWLHLPWLRLKRAWRRWSGN